MFRAYIKDCTNLGGNTKALLTATKGKIKEDRMQTANSTITFDEVSNNVSIGDVLFLLNNNGKTLYKGIITKIKNNEITTSQLLNLYSGKFIYSLVDELKDTSPSTYLEEEIKKVLNYYSQGKIFGSTYIDPLVAQKLSSIQLESVNSLETLLESDTDEEGNERWTQKDMVDWLYKLYDKYGIVFDFTMPLQSGTNTLKIWKPNYTGMKMVDGFECVSTITPTNQAQGTNRIVVYWNSSEDGHMAKEYRSTYVLTNNGIVEEPSEIIGRLNQVNTEYIFSDDPIEDVIASHLNETMFNHKVEFEVNLHSKLFTFDDLKLDVPIEVYIGRDYYNTLITAKEYSFDVYGQISSLKITGGKIRNSLTNKLSLGLI